MADLKISIGSEFDNKGFKKAEGSVSALTRGAKQLAGAFGAAFSVRAIARYGIASVKAAAQDEAAQKQLALALKNVGLGRDAALSESYIQKLQSELGVLDDELRPAYQGLAIAVKDTGEAQRLLLLSLNISKSTGKSLTTVTAALSKAYLGNNTSLSKLGVGISKADLKSKSFLEITNQLSSTFAGGAKTAADSYEGSLNKLTAASNNVKEAIGTGIIDALKMLGEENSVNNLAKSMQNAALYTADVIRGIGVLISELKKIPGVSGFNVGMIPIVGSYLQLLQQKGAGKGGGFSQGAPSDLMALAPTPTLTPTPKPTPTTTPTATPTPKPTTVQNITVYASNTNDIAKKLSKAAKNGTPIGGK